MVLVYRMLTRLVEYKDFLFLEEYPMKQEIKHSQCFSVHLVVKMKKGNDYDVDATRLVKPIQEVSCNTWNSV